MSEPDEDGNYTEEGWDNLPVAHRMRLCASGQYEIYPSDMTDAADRIEKLEAALRQIRELHHGPENEDVSIRDDIWIRDDMTYKIVCDTLEGKDD